MSTVSISQCKLTVGAPAMSPTERIEDGEVIFAVLVLLGKGDARIHMLSRPLARDGLWRQTPKLVLHTILHFRHVASGQYDEPRLQVWSRREYYFTSLTP